MVKQLNFNTQKKKTLNLTMPVEFFDGNEAFVADKDGGAVLMVTTPSKGIMAEFVESQDEISALGEGGGVESLDVIYDLTAKILGNNRQGFRPTVEACEEFFDIEDLVVLFGAYTEYLTEIFESKNASPPITR